METYEKKYKEALEKAKRLYEKGTITESLCHIFPELEGSEDEKTRKALISFLKSPFVNENITDEKVTPWITWLEKQKEPELSKDLGDYIAELSKQFPEVSFAKLSRIAVRVKNWLEKQGDNTPTIIWHNIDEKPEEMKELFCEWESDDATWHDVAFYDEESHTFRHAKMPINVTKWVYVDELLEKQGEQKPFDYENANISQHDFAPKVEPKFHEGEWIVDNIGVAHQIERPVLIVANNTFGYDIVGGGYLDDDSDVHLWTIQDAKDGDVLAVDSKPFIYNGSKNEVTVGAYCGFNSEHKFSFAYNYVINQNITPATKEQRDLLFQKMKEEGYEWDAERKELKKINKNTDVGHEYFSDLLEKDDYDNIDDYASQCAYCMSHDWMKDTATWDDVEEACKIGAKWNERHHKSAGWSEEDEAMLDGIILRCEKYGYQEQINWLNSLKNRVLPQPKQEWSEEDEVRLQACLDTLQAKSLMGKDDTIMTEWLKSLKDRVQPIHEYSDTERQEMFIKSQRPHFWKPTDKQMDTLLSEVTGWTKGCPKQKVLESLYNDLKKLREGEL